ncbi:MAG: glycoside hydrolase family 3 C-terminal domain-containing protein [Anaerolineae bacterium]
MSISTKLSSEKIDHLISQLTLEEKVAMMAGSDIWHTVAVPRLGIPALKMSDGPNGARGDAFRDGKTAAVFPVGIVLAQTWNTALLEQIGAAIAEEAKTKGAQVILAPTVNIHRSPLGGRNFESYSEDPYLAARMTVAYIKGVQSQGVSAMVKHYIGNEQEAERYSMNSIIDERTLREIYMPPFEAAVREAQVGSIMASYNLVNGVAVSEDPYLLNIPRNEWGWDGPIVSDWVWSVKSTAASVNAGLDIEMPGPGIWRGEKLLAAVKNGEVAESTLDESVRRLLIWLDKVGKFEHPDEAPEQAIDRPEHRALIRKAAGEGFVLLKNERGALPLQRDSLRSVALIGPNAKVARIMGGGSSEVNAHYRVSPYEGITAILPDRVTVGFEEGCLIHKLLPLAEGAQFLAGKTGTEPGLLVEYFNSPTAQGDPVVTAIHANATEFVWFGTLPAGVNPDDFSVRVTGRFLPKLDGSTTMGLVSVGASRLLMDGEMVIDNWTNWQVGKQNNYFGMGSDEQEFALDLAAGEACLLQLEFHKSPQFPFPALRLGILDPHPTDGIERAAKLAAQSDVALIFAGMSGEWDSEGFDRPDLELPREQNELIRRVAAANPNTVVVLNTGSAVTMPWLDQVAAVVHAGYPGQEAGNAIADVLFGEVNPSGKLTQTYPARLEDSSSYLNFPGENGNVLYGERIFVGYRYFDKRQIDPLFPFGFGLSYTTFAYENVRLSTKSLKAGETLTVSFDVINTGARAGQEVVQIYVRDHESRLSRPDKELKAFAKVALEPGERKTVTLSLSRESFAYFDDTARKWTAEAGAFDVLVGASSRDIRALETIDLTETQQWF